MASSCTFSDRACSPASSFFALCSACASEYHRRPANRDDAAGARDRDGKGEEEMEGRESLVHCDCWRARLWRDRERRGVIMMVNHKGFEV